MHKNMSALAMDDVSMVAGGESAQKGAVKSLTYADLIVAYLAQINVEYVFGVPGGAIEPLFDALARSERGDESIRNLTDLPVSQRHNARVNERKRSGPRVIIARHEAGAAFMADGYSRETGRLGVCCATTGPGATNLITGVAGAFADEVPMLVITPQTALPNFGRQSLQESSVDAIDTVGMFKHCTRYNTMVSHEAQLEKKLMFAIASAFRHPRGPSHISIPMDILAKPIGEKSFSYNVGTMLRQPHMVDQQQLDALCEQVINTLCLRQQKIVVVVGQGCRDTFDLVRHFCELTGSPIVSTPSGKRWVDTHHPLYKGVFGFAGHSSAAEALRDANTGLILAIGAEMGELSTNGWDERSLLNERLIHIDACMGKFDQSFMASLHVYGNYREVLAELNTALDHLPDGYHLPAAASEGSGGTATLRHGVPAAVVVDEPEQCLSVSSPLKPQRLMFDLVRRLPENTRFMIDAGNAWCWATHYLHPRATGCYHIAMGYGAMAWAIGSSVGVAMGNRQVPVVCLTGDGSFLMSGQEVTVALAENLSVIFIVLNDQVLGMVKHGQRLGGGEPIGFDLPAVDFAAMAKAMGVRSHRVVSAEDWAALDLEALLAPGGPVLLDILIDGEEVPPMGSRVKVLRNQQ